MKLQSTFAAVGMEFCRKNTTNRIEDVMLMQTTLHRRNKIINIIIYNFIRLEMMIIFVPTVIFHNFLRHSFAGI